MLNAVQAIIAFILALAPLVFFHELGHFLVAKAFRIGVPVFSLGFGPRIFGFRRGGTDYRVSAVPLGGYVRLKGDEADEERTGAPDEFLTRPKYQRFLVFVAGAVFNVLLAFLLMWLFFGIYGAPVEGKRYPTVVLLLEDGEAQAAGVEVGDRLISIAGRDMRDDANAHRFEIDLDANKTKELIVERDGERRTLRLGTGQDEETGLGDPGWLLSVADVPELGTIVKGGAAEAAGLQVGDRIVGAAGREPVDEQMLRELLSGSAGVPVPMRIDRGGQVTEIVVTPEDVGGDGKIGVLFSPSNKEPLGFGAAGARAWQTIVRDSQTLLLFLKKMFTGGVSAKSVSGPIGIAQVSSQAMQLGFEPFLRFMAFISLQLGIINLLPIPVLDGGHILILTIEGAMRRDLSDRIKERVMQFGFIFLLAVMTAVIASDVYKLF